MESLMVKGEGTGRGSTAPNVGPPACGVQQPALCLSWEARGGSTSHKGVRLNA